MDFCKTYSPARPLDHRRTFHSWVNSEVKSQKFMEVPLWLRKVNKSQTLPHEPVPHHPTSLHLKDNLTIQFLLVLKTNHFDSSFHWWKWNLFFSPNLQWYIERIHHVFSYYHVKYVLFCVVSKYPKSKSRVS